jgi:hypothetical protein
MPTSQTAGGAFASSRLVPAPGLATAPNRSDPEAAARVLAAALPERSRLPRYDQQPLPGVPARHVASLGASLFTDHLIAVQVAAVLLFIALVAGASIAKPKPQVRPTDRRRLEADQPSSSSPSLSTTR